MGLKFNNPDTVARADLVDVIQVQLPLKANQSDLNTTNSRVTTLENDLQQSNISEDIYNTASVFTAGKGKDSNNQDYDVSGSLVNGQFSEMIVKGRTSRNIAKGKFDTTDEWYAIIGSTTLSVSNNILTSTGTGVSLSNPACNHVTDTPWQINKKVFARAMVRVTNSDCSKIVLEVRGTNGKITEAEISTPVNGQWYNLSVVATNTSGTGNVEILLYHNYADTTTANGKVMEVKEVIAIDATVEGMNTWTVDQINAAIPYWFDSTKSTLPVRITSTVNLFDKNSEYESSNGFVTSIPLVSGIKVKTDDAVGYGYAVYRRKLEPNTIYTFSFNKTAISGSESQIAIMDKNLITSFGSWAVGGSYNITTPSDGEIALLFYATTATAAVGEVDFTDVMLNVGATAKEYSEYAAGGQVYVKATDSEGNILELRSLPNGVNDEINVNERKVTWNVGNKVLEESDITGMVIGYDNLDYAEVTKPLDYISSGNFSSFDSQLKNYNEFDTGVNGIDNAINVGQYTSAAHPSKLWVGFEKGTTLEQAQTALVGLALSYQLNNSIVEDVEVDGDVYSFGAGTTVIVESYHKQPHVYGTGITFDYAVSAIDKILDISGNEVDSVDITLAADGLSATIADATETSVYTVYAPYKTENSTVPTTIHAANLNRAAQIDSNTTSAIRHSVTLSKHESMLLGLALGYIDLDARITALENE